MLLLFPYTLSVNGKEQNFPMTYDEFLALGWDSVDPMLTASEMGESYTLGADCSGTIFSGGTGTEYTTAGIEGIWLMLYNPTEAELPIKDCMMIGLGYDERLEDRNMTAGAVQITNGGSTVSIGESTLDEVKAAFGEPTYEIGSEEEATTTYVYGATGGNWILYISFDGEGVFKYFKYKCAY